MSLRPVGPSDSTDMLLERLLAGDRRAWEQLIEQFAPLLLAIARRTLAHYGSPPRPEDAEDVVADVWKNLVENDLRIVRQCLENGNFLQVIHVLARNRSVDLLRKRQAYRTVPLVFDAPAEEPEIGEESSSAELVEYAARGLADRELLLVRLFFLQKKKYREIATLTGIPQNSIGPTLARALAKMRKRLLADAPSQGDAV